MNNMTHAVYPSLAGKTVVITGGGSGIGEVMVEGFVRQKAKVFFLDVAEDESKALVARLGDGAQFIKCDVTDVKALRAAFADDRSQGRPGCGAGEQRRERRPPQGRRRDAGILGEPHRGEPAAPVLRGAGGHAGHEEGRRRLHHQSRLGVVAHRHLPDLSLYETAKAGIEGMTRALARDLGEAEHPRQLRGARRDPHAAPDEVVAHARGRGQDPRAAVPEAEGRSGSRDSHGAVPRLRGCRHVHGPQLLGRRRLLLKSMTMPGQSSNASGRSVQCSVKDRSGPRRSRPSGSSTSRHPRFTVFTRRAARRRSWPAPARVGFVLPTRAGWMIAGLKTGLHSFNPETGNFNLLHVVEPHAPNNRLNDGFVDSEGFLWFGSMDDNEEDPSGALYQLGDEGCVTPRPGLRGQQRAGGKSRRQDAVSHRHAGRRHLRLRSRAQRLAVEQARVCAAAGRQRLSGRPHRRRRRLPLDRRIRRLGRCIVTRPRASC